PFFAWWHACGASVPQPFLAGLAKEASAMPAARWRGILEEVRMTDLATEARAVRTRTLIIAGACDPLFGEAHQQALAEALTGSSLVRAQNCGHNPH
ncbi:alpha/beta hydrolase, partial [bacterium M00.F.Ca.ET.221.01.1.1]